MTMTPEERKLRDLLWAGHACPSKYGDDGEIQCSAFLPVIDFQRDTPTEIEIKQPLHYIQLKAQLAQKGLRGAEIKSKKAPVQIPKGDGLIREAQNRPDRDGFEDAVRGVLHDFDQYSPCLLKALVALLPDEKSIREQVFKVIEEAFIWGQVPYLDSESAAIKEWTMRCISDKEWQALKKEVSK